MTDAFAQARDQEVAFKHEELLRYACGFVLAALALKARGVAFVGSDDVEDKYQPGPDSKGIPGSAVTMLRNAHVIQDFRATVLEQNIFGGHRRSKRPSANGRKVPLYRLVSVAAAETFLERHGPVEQLARPQRELALEVRT